jgi:hypothetical protein
MAVVTASLTGTGATNVITGTAIDVSVSGIASSTVQIQRRIGDNWRTIEALTADGERVVENATGLEHRCNVSVFGSGTIAITMVSR